MRQILVGFLAVALIRQPLQAQKIDNETARLSAESMLSWRKPWVSMSMVGRRFDHRLCPWPRS